MKCKKGYKQVRGKCVSSTSTVFQPKGVLGHNLIARNVIVGIAFVLAFLWVINPPARSAVGINLIFLAIAFIVYNAREYQDDLIGISRKNLLPSIGYGILATFFFFIITLLVPGMSIGYPSLPASIGDNLKFFLVVIIAPIAESLFFCGALYAWFNNFDVTQRKEKKWRAIIFMSFFFSLFHLGAYISGLYNYPDFVSGMSAFMANLSSFIVAFIFMLVTGIIITRDGIKNLVFGILFHLGLNLIAFSLSVAVFLLSYSFIF